MNCNDSQFHHLNPASQLAVTRRTFLARSAGGIGLAALGSLLSAALVAGARCAPASRRASEPRLRAGLRPWEREQGYAGVRLAHVLWHRAQGPPAALRPAVERGLFAVEVSGREVSQQGRPGAVSLESARHGP